MVVKSGLRKAILSLFMPVSSDPTSRSTMAPPAIRALVGTPLLILVPDVPSAENPLTAN